MADHYPIERYNDIIVVHGGYKQVNFQQFLSRYYQREVWLVDNGEINDALKSKLTNEEFGDVKKNYFFKRGILATLPISELQFYQPYVGIEGPRYHALNDPVFVIKIAVSYVLWEGYHRIFRKMIVGEKSVSCYVLPL